MKQLFQDLTNGKTQIVETPASQVKPGYVLINTLATLVSPGTERMLVDFSQASYLKKARQQPEKVKQVLAKVKTDGLITTINAVRTKLAQPLPLGYCNVGVVSTVGKGVEKFKLGDRVVSNGPHADVVNIPRNLCAVIPDNVDDESAAFTVLASIGLQGIRLGNLTLGESVAVIGVGLIGLITVQLLHAQGCRVLAIDFDPAKLQLAKQFGADICYADSNANVVAAGMAFSRGYGMDAVIITASTQSHDPVAQAAQMSRKRGRIILVGVTGLNINRDDFYKKELLFQVSCSYGPGRYDINYEEAGNDYPIGFVRWTEQRNFEAILDMMSAGLLNVKPLITHRFEFEDALQAYKLLTEDKTILGILLKYTSEITIRNISTIQLNKPIKFDAAKPIIGLVGAGNYATRILIPACKAAMAQLHTIITTGGVNGAINGKQAGFQEAATDINYVLDNRSINTIIIATRHNTHAELVVKALNAAKHVFVEKPLAITLEQIDNIENAYNTARDAGSNVQLMVGFNRRFAPQVQKMKILLDAINEPKSFIITINAGTIPAEHWTQDKLVGGGRIIGEACHFIDLMRFLASSKIISTHAKCMSMGRGNSNNIVEDKVAIILGFANGSFGTIHYLANGSASFPKERIEVFAAGKILQLDNFVKLKAFGWPGFKKMNLWRQDKGQGACIAKFLTTIVQGSEPLVPIDEIFEVARVSIQVAERSIMKKLMVVLGTRPEAIKMAPVILALRKKFQVIVCITTQHREMLYPFLELFSITADFDLNIMQEGQDLFDVNSKVLLGMREVLSKTNPDCVLVQGDTTTCMAAAMAAFYKKIPVAHVEAGLRTNNLYSPYPEEFNRQVTARIAKFNFAPTEISKNNLLNEGIKESTIFVTGNTVIDALFSMVKKIKNNDTIAASINSKFKFLHAQNSKLILVTGHRRESFGEDFEQICLALHDIAIKIPEVIIVYPVHLNPNVQDPVNRILAKISNIHLIEPLDYLNFVFIMERAYLILTDSGGIQEEAPSLGKPVLVMRKVTERPEAVAAGTTKVVGVSRDEIVKNTLELFINNNIYKSMSCAANPYGDGQASERICKILQEFLCVA